MEEILDLASKLSRAVANHERFKRFKEAEEQLKNAIRLGRQSSFPEFGETEKLLEGMKR